MTMEPYRFSLPIHQFDVQLLPPAARTIGSTAFRDAVILHFVRKYVANGEHAIVSVDDKEIHVVSFPANLDPHEYVQSLLQSGRIKEALPYLEAMVETYKTDAEALYNLGLAYSELGRYEDAVMRLKKAVENDPNHSNAWVGIGLAYIRLKRIQDAIDALNKAINLNPANGYAHRNMGGLLSIEDNHKAALPHFREAVHQLPNDPQALYGLAKCLEQLGELEEADGLYLNVIDRFPLSQVAEPARSGRTSIAHKNLRSNAVGGLRPDVMMYITGALDTFKKLGPKKRQEIAFEIGMKGQSGLDINDPDQKYSLNSLPGKFSGLHLLAIMYAAFQEIDPALDVGANFKTEYQMALKLQDDKR